MGFDSNPRVPCKSSVLPRLNLELWRESKGKPNVKNPQQFAPSFGPPSSLAGGFNNVSTQLQFFFWCRKYSYSLCEGSRKFVWNSHDKNLKTKFFSGAIVQRPEAFFQLIDKIYTKGRRDSVQSTEITRK